MKKLFLIFSLLLLVVGSVGVSAELMPMVVYGTVSFDDVTYAYQKVDVYSLRLGYTWSFETNINGVYEVTFNGMKDDLRREIDSGDVVEIRACPETANPGCVRTVTVSSEPQRVDIHVGGVSPDGDAIDAECLSQCPILTCPVCDECTIGSCDEDEGGDALWIIISGALTGLVGLGIGSYFVKRKEALSKGVGIKIYTKRDGSEGVVHKHPGIRGYHEPNTSHRLVKEKHPRGELTPKYEKDMVSGEWVYVG